MNAPCIVTHPKGWAVLIPGAAPIPADSEKEAKRILAMVRR